jgi:hypothetical protein
LACENNGKQINNIPSVTSALSAAFLAGTQTDAQMLKVMGLIASPLSRFQIGPGPDSRTGNNRWTSCIPSPEQSQEMICKKLI